MRTILPIGILLAALNGGCVSFPTYEDGVRWQEDNLTHTSDESKLTRELMTTQNILAHPDKAEVFEAARQEVEEKSTGMLAAAIASATLNTTGSTVALWQQVGSVLGMLGGGVLSIFGLDKYIAWRGKQPQPAPPGPPAPVTPANGTA